VFYTDPHQIYRLRAFERLGWLDAGFGTRHSTAWPPAPAATLQQIHSGIAITVDERTGCLGEGDALLTARPGVYLAIRTADCVPVLIADERHRAVAAVHSGWRGTVLQISATAVAEMSRQFSSHPGDLTVAIGPSICGSCYSVGPEVAAQFKDLFPERSDLDARANIDLAEAIQRQLLVAGVIESRIHTAKLCSFCRAGDFHSFRRDREAAGRMHSCIAIRM
jgi:polyphenol oxidase